MPHEAHTETRTVTAAETTAERSPETTRAGAPSREPRTLRSPTEMIRRRPWLLSALLFVLLCTVNAAYQDAFFQSGVMVSNLATFLPMMIIAVGQTYVVLGGSIDLSLGAIVSLVNVVVIVIVEALGGTGWALAPAMAAGLAVGAACGWVNGAIISVLRLQPIVATFATGVIIGGLALVVLPQAGGLLPPAYYLTYGGAVLGVPTPVIVFAGLVLVAVLVGRSRFRTHLTAVGGDVQAAFQTGLDVGTVRLRSHMLAGLLSAVAALCILGQTGAGDPLMGQAFTLGSVSAVVLGGTALAGGWGGVIGSMLGGAILGLVNNVIFFAQINYVYQSIVQGAIILVALAAGVFVSRRGR